MAPKKRGNKDEPAAKEYTFLTREEMRNRELKYVNRLNELKVCVHYIDGKIKQILFRVLDLFKENRDLLLI